MRDENKFNVRYVEVEMFVRHPGREVRWSEVVLRKIKDREKVMNQIS